MGDGLKRARAAARATRTNKRAEARRKAHSIAGRLIHNYLDLPSEDPAESGTIEFELQKLADAHARKAGL